MPLQGKRVKSKGSLFFVYASGAEHPFDARIAQVLQQEFPHVLMEFAVMQAARHACEVRYDATRMDLLSKHLKKPLDHQGLLLLLDQFRQLVQECARLGLPLKNVVFDEDRVFYDPWSRSVRFLYVPFDGMVPDVRVVRSFFEGFARAVKPLDEGAARVQAAYCRYFQTGGTFGPTEFAQFLEALIADEKAGAGAPLQRERERAARTEKRLVNAVGKHAKPDWNPKKVVVPVGRSALDGRETHKRPLSAFLPSVDLCAVVANALDNAIHASEEVEEGKRFVSVKTHLTGGFFVLNVRNACKPDGGAAKGEASWRRGAGLSEHGLGVSIMENVAKRHDGSFDIDQKDDVCTTSVVMRADS